jgi:hypothetical protein
MRTGNMMLMIVMIVSSSLAQVEPARPFLSSLAATADAPLFTTYAARMERSEFTLDKGYHFVFYDSTRGADFTNELAGDICLGFKMGGKYVYALTDMYRRPVINASYADLVNYTFYPFDSIKVDVTFLVYSSHMAVQDIYVKNTGRITKHIELLPFLRNTYRTYDSIAYHPNVNAITFRHEEFPDDWVLDHKVPYVNKLQDVFVISDPPDRMTSFRSYRWGTVEIPQANDLEHPRVYPVWGRITQKGGGRCAERSSESRLMAVVNDDWSRLITETAPRWGSAEKNISRYGYYGLELGNFGPLRDGDRFTVFGYCAESGQTGERAGVVQKRSDGEPAEVDLQLGEFAGPNPPEEVRMDIWGSGTEVRLSWKKDPEAVSYSVYRRDYRASGVYDRIAEGLQQLFFTDKDVPGDKIYGYVVVAVDKEGRRSIHSREVNNIAGSDFLTDVKYPGQGVSNVKDLARIVAFARAYDLRPGYTHRLIAVRAVGRATDTQQHLLDSARGLVTLDIPRCTRESEALYSKIAAPKFADPDWQMLYWSSFSLMRQVMLPPEGKSSFNYYVFSREPQWGWGHGGQVFHESLTMLAYALMDPTSAMNSQRVYRERQHKDGYINYRTGPYLDETIPYAGQLTTSAPWYAWQNWEVYKISKDRKFLEEMYQSSSSFHDYYVANRDSDGDGLCEWGGEAILESVRDGKVAVWDKVGYPSNFEAVDLNCMLVMEEKSLAAMAAELGKPGEAKAWESKAAARAKKINATMWDEETGFYYNVGKKDHTFSFKSPNDLKREEIIGFLPLWAGIADSARAKRLVEKLSEPDKFWRRFGVPSLSAGDSYYDPKGYWNGPVWVQWDYLIERGLLEYGYKAEAKELVRRVAAGMIAQLKKDHDMWEFYSPDDEWAGYHKTYIWAGIVARMMSDIMEN